MVDNFICLKIINFIFLKITFLMKHYLLIFSSKSSGFTSSVIFDGIEEALKNDGKSLVNKVKGIFAFKVKKPDGKNYKPTLHCGFCDALIFHNSLLYM